MTRRKCSRRLQVSPVFFPCPVCVPLFILVLWPSPCNMYSILARLQAPEAAADKKTDQQESDITSQEASIHTASLRRNGSVTNSSFPVRHGSRIDTITQSACRTDRGSVVGSVRSPTATRLTRHRPEHIPSRSDSH